MHHLTVDLITPAKESPRARLLVVGDDPLIRELHAVVLRMDGYEVVTAEDGVAALELLAEERFDLVLTERRMPKFGGAYRPRTAFGRQPHPGDHGFQLARGHSTSAEDRRRNFRRHSETRPRGRSALSRRPSAAAPTAAGKTMSRSGNQTFGRLTNRKENCSNPP
jgi:CheY-like chemotaxis protein